MNVELTLTGDAKHLLLGEVDDKVVTPKKSPEKRQSEKAVEEVDKGEKTSSSLKFDDGFTWSSPPHCLRSVRRSLSRVL